MTAADGVVSLIFIPVLFLFISCYCCSSVSKKFCCFSLASLRQAAKFLPLAIKTNYVRHLFQDMANNSYNNNNNNNDDDDGKCEGTITKSTPKKLKPTK